MHPAQGMTQGCKLPAGATLLGYATWHPSERRSYEAIIRFDATGIESAWRGESVRGLPNDWRRHCDLTPAK